MKKRKALLNTTLVIFIWILSIIDMLCACLNVSLKMLSRALFKALQLNVWQDQEHPCHLEACHWITQTTEYEPAF